MAGCFFTHSGRNYMENPFPHVLQDHGYKFSLGKCLGDIKLKRGA